MKFAVSRKLPPRITLISENSYPENSHPEKFPLAIISSQTIPNLIVVLVGVALEPT